MLLGLKVVVRCTQLSVNLIQNVKEVRTIGPHFDQNQIKTEYFFLNFLPFSQVPVGLCTSFGPPVQGVAVTCVTTEH